MPNIPNVPRKRKTKTTYTSNTETVDLEGPVKPFIAKPEGRMERIFTDHLISKQEISL